MRLLSIGLLTAALTLCVGGAKEKEKKQAAVPFEQAQKFARPSMPANPTVTLTNWEVYQGSSDDMFDSDDSTKYWLKEPTDTSSLEITFDSPTEIYDIQIKFNGNDYLRHGRLRWSNDGSHYMRIKDFDLTENQVVNIQAFGIEATKLRLDNNAANNSSCWVQIQEIAINVGTFDDELIQKISFKNFGENYLPTDAVKFETSLNSMVDGDPDTFTSFAGATANSTYIQFDFKEAIPLRTFTYQNSNAATKYSADHIYGGQLKYFDTATNDYEEIGEKTKDTYDLQKIYLANEYKTTASVRFVITDVVGWIIAGDFSFETFVGGEKDPIIKVDYDDATGTYQGNILNILDNDESTFCWFNGRINSVTLDLGSVTTIYDVKFVTGNGSGGDTFEAFVEYSTDNDTYSELVENYSWKTSDTIILENPVSAQYVRLTKHYGAGWNSVKDFTINNTKQEFSINGDDIVYPLVEHSDLNNAIDGDLNSVVWIDYHFSSGTEFIVDLKNIENVDNIAFLQGGFTNDSYVHRTEGNDDKLTTGQLSYSKDGWTWVNVSTDCTVLNVFYEFSSSVEARYLKMTYTGSSASLFGLVIREFTVNFSSIDPEITWQSNDQYYTGDPIKGYEMFSFASGYVATYENTRTSTALSEAPTDPGEYRVTLTTAGNDIYNADSSYFNYHIYDTVNHFIDSWQSSINLVCSNNAEDLAKLFVLVDRYDNDLKSADKATVAATSYTGADSKTYTIADGIEFVRNRSLPLNNSQNGSLIWEINNMTTESSIIIIVAVLAVTAIAGFTILQAKKTKRR